MTIGELINILKRCPQDALAIVPARESGYKLVNNFAIYSLKKREEEGSWGQGDYDGELVPSDNIEDVEEGCIAGIHITAYNT